MRGFLHKITRHNQYELLETFCSEDSNNIIIQAKKINPSILNFVVNFNCKRGEVQCPAGMWCWHQLKLSWRKTNISGVDWLDWVILLNNYTAGVLLINCPPTDYCAWTSIIFSSPPWLLHQQFMIQNWQTTPLTDPVKSVTKKLMLLNPKTKS